MDGTGKPIQVQAGNLNAALQQANAAGAAGRNTVYEQFLGAAFNTIKLD